MASKRGRSAGSSSPALSPYLHLPSPAEEWRFKPHRDLLRVGVRGDGVRAV